MKRATPVGKAGSVPLVTCDHALGRIYAAKSRLQLNNSPDAIGTVPRRDHRCRPLSLAEKAPP